MDKELLYAIDNVTFPDYVLVTVQEMCRQLAITITVANFTLPFSLRFNVRAVARRSVVENQLRFVSDTLGKSTELTGAKFRRCPRAFYA